MNIHIYTLMWTYRNETISLFSEHTCICMIYMYIYIYIYIYTYISTYKVIIHVYVFYRSSYTRCIYYIHTFICAYNIIIYVYVFYRSIHVYTSTWTNHSETIALSSEHACIYMMYIHIHDMYTCIYMIYIHDIYTHVYT